MRVCVLVLETAGQRLHARPSLYPQQLFAQSRSFTGEPISNVTHWNTLIVLLLSKVRVIVEQHPPGPGIGVIHGRVPDTSVPLYGPAGASG